MTLLKQCDGCGRWLHDPIAHDCTGDRPRHPRATPWSDPDLLPDFPPGPPQDRWTDGEEPRIGTKLEEEWQ